MCTLQVCWIESPSKTVSCWTTIYCASMFRNQPCWAECESPHISSNINATTELSTFTNKRDLQPTKLVHTEVSNDWLPARVSGSSQGMNLLIWAFARSNSTSDYLDPVNTHPSWGCSKVRNKDLVFPLGMNCDFLREWQALLGQFHHNDKVVFTVKTTLRVLQIFLGLLPILNDSRERQANPDSPSS